MLDDNGKATACPDDGHAGINIQKGIKGFQNEYGSARQISLWRDTTG